MSTEAESGYALELRGITKSFGRNSVLKDVSLSLKPGRIMALLGANGAGKSTLIKILAGAYQRDAGEILVSGAEVDIHDPMSAAAQGIQTVHQRIDQSVVPGMTVAENFLFEDIVKGTAPKVSSTGQLVKLAKPVAATLDLDWPDKKMRSDVFELGTADTQLMLLARALVEHPKVLVLDEPTSALSQAEVERLFDVIRRLRSEGMAILYVSHHLSEIVTLADDLAVLRDGRVEDRQQAPLDMDRAVRSMLSQDVSAEAAAVTEQRGDKVAIELHGVQLLKRSAPVDLQLRYGEVTGIIGLLGAGKSEFARSIFGVDPLRAGSMTLNGKPYRPTNAHHGVQNGIYLVPEDRAKEAMLPKWSVSHTASLPFISRFSPVGVIDFKREKVHGQRILTDFAVVSTGPDQRVDALSGGNQQKVVVGRWMSGDPKIILLDEPFRGVDIGARHDLSAKARQAAKDGACVVVLSSDIEEIEEVADRVLVLVEGHFVLDRYTTEVDRDTIVASMSEEKANV